MGFITTLTANNDTIHLLPEYPDLGDEIYSAISKLSIEKPVRVGRSGLVAHECHHMDYGAAILIGGGQEARELGASVFWRDKDSDVNLLRQLAQKHGFELRRRR